jgi:hypothetical protein
MTKTNGKGGFVVIDDDKLDKECWLLMGGVQALEAASQTIKAIRDKSTVIQERQFLAEIRDLLKQMAEQHKTVLAATAMKLGAGTLYEGQPEGAKPN